MMKRDIIDLGVNGFMYLLSATQTKEIFEIISLVLSIAMSIFLIVSKIVYWYKKAKEDGKIDKEEVEELIDIIKDGQDKLGGNVNDIQRNNGKSKSEDESKNLR